MPIVIDCPQCGKRYEVDDAHAGKKSRCKQCGEVFKIAVPQAGVSERALVREPVSTAPKERAASDWSSILADPKGAAKPDVPPAAPVEAIVAVTSANIVLNCPKCLKRYEVDGALAGKRSRCKDCGEVFTIPAASGRFTKPEPVRPAPPVKPAPVPSYWESALEAEAAPPSYGRPMPQHVVEEEEILPPRAAKPVASRTKSSRRDPIDSEFGVTVAGFYAAVSILILIVLAGWYAASDTMPARFRVVFGITFFSLMGIGWLLSAAGNIWLLVIAFREKLEQGVLCLVVPCYALYYTVSRWREARGTFALQVSFAVVSTLLIFSRAYMFNLMPNMGDLESKLAWLDDTPKPGAEFDAVQGDEPVRPFGNQPAPFGGGGPPMGRPNLGGPHRGGPHMGGPPPGFPIMPRGKAVSFDDWVKENLATQGDRAVGVVNFGVPINNDPKFGPTSRDVTDAIGKRLKELAPAATSSVSIGTGDKWATFLSPVDDVRALARMIDFGKVSVKGRQIHVQLATEYITSVPRTTTAVASAQPPRAREREPDPVIPDGADAVTKSLIQLKSHNKEQRKEALRRLRRTTPNERQEEVVDALVPLLDDDDTFVIDEVLQAMDTWQSPKAVPALIHRTKDDRIFVRRRAIKTLGRYKDPRAIDPIADCLKEDGFEAKDALIEMGPMVEPAMIDRLRHQDRRIRKLACEVLMYVGGHDTLKAMQTIPPDADLGVQNDARRAIKQIVSRVGPLPKAADTKKAATSAAPKKRKQP
jgi:predicted Zn finger-like uncharacterized protein